jgi:tetratricopeptide (TPR) repeat protein
MELTLARQDVTTTQVSVSCDGQPSHTFDLHALIPDDEQGLPGPFKDATAYGAALFAALFAPGTAASTALSLEYGQEQARVLLVTSDEMLETIPWEYAYGPDGFLVCDLSFVRGLPSEQRIAPPERVGSLHLVAVASNPLHPGLAPLNISGEWMRLKEIVAGLDSAVTLDRVWPPTIERLRERVAHQRQRVVHFMGHGGQDERVGAVLCFEQDNGSLEAITASEFTKRLRGSVFLVTLNACESAMPGETHFSNLAAALARVRTPYALGMRFSIVDDDALAFSRAFYGDLARGVSVEEAVWQARLSLRKSKRAWAIGVPVLYTALDLPARTPPLTFSTEPGVPAISDPQQPALRRIIGILPQIEGAFQGRTTELIQLGDWLTGDSRPRLVTIHGSGGQGKTTLAREAVERFAYAWPGGVWAISLETLPTRPDFVVTLARFLGIDASELERQVLQRLAMHRTLVVLDNAETLDIAVKSQHAEALQLADFIQRLPSSTVSLLVTSRHLLGWSGEQTLELEGLTPEEGAALFLQSASGRAPKLNPERAQVLAQQLSRRVDGHPFGLFLLGKAFDSSPIPLESFILHYESWLLAAENRYSKVADYRQRTIYSIFDYSARNLDGDLRGVLSQVWLFHAPFLASTAVAIFDPQHDAESGTRSPVEDHLHALWQLGLLSLEETGSDALRLYSVPPVMRPYIERYLAVADGRESLLARFGNAYAGFADYLYTELNRGGLAPFLAMLCRADLERGLTCVTGGELASYQLRWGWVLQRLGYRQQGMALTEQALEYAQGQDNRLMLQAMNNMAIVYRQTGQIYQALRLNEQALGIRREVGDRAGEGTTLHNIGMIYAAQGRFDVALACVMLAKALYEYVQSPSDVDDEVQWIAALQNSLGEERFSDLYRQVAGRAEEIVQKGLHDGLPPGGVAQSSSTMPAERVATIVKNTVAVMTIIPERHGEWRAAMSQALEDARHRGADWQIEVDFFAAILDLLDGQAADLPGGHPYVAALEQMKQGIADGGPGMGKEDVPEEIRALLSLAEASIAALRGDPQERMALVQQLVPLQAQETDEGLKALLQAIQLALVGDDLAQLGGDLDGVYKQVWEAIMAGVFNEEDKTDGGENEHEET